MQQHYPQYHQKQRSRPQASIHTATTHSSTTLATTSSLSSSSPPPATTSSPGPSSLRHGDTNGVSTPLTKPRTSTALSISTAAPSLSDTPKSSLPASSSTTSITATVPANPSTPLRDRSSHTDTEDLCSPDPKPEATSSRTHFDIVHHPVKDTLLIVSSMLSLMVYRNDKLFDPLRSPITLFHSRGVPRFSIHSYLTRILRFIPFTNEVLLNVLVFLDRIGGLEGMELVGMAVAQSTHTLDTPSSAASTESELSSPLFARPSFPSRPNSSHPPSFSAALQQTNPATHSPSSEPALPMVQKRGSQDVSVAGSSPQKKQKTIECTTNDTETTMPMPENTSSPVDHPPSLVTNGFRINSFNIYRLLIISLMVAAKFTSDHFYPNTRYALVGGLSLPELNQLELEFLFTSKFELNVKEEALQKVGDALLQFKNKVMTPSQQAPSAPATQAPMTTTADKIEPHSIDTTCRPSQVMPGRFSIPSPTSPRSGSMPCHPTKGAVPHSVALKEAQSQSPLEKEPPTRSQLLSPPEEKLNWPEAKAPVDGRVDPGGFQQAVGTPASTSKPHSTTPSNPNT